MTKKSNEPTDKEARARREALKYEIAGELGLLERVESGGWKMLTSRESGRVGGLLAKREKELREKQKDGDQV